MNMLADYIMTEFMNVDTLILFITTTITILEIFKIWANRDITKSELKLKTVIVEEENKSNQKVLSKLLESMPENIDEDKFFEKFKDELEKVKNLNSDSFVKNENLNKLLEIHHKQALRHASVQFWFSICMSVIGFGFIIIMIVTTSKVEWYEYILKILPGTIMEAVSVLFINQARETRERATAFFKELNYEKYISQSMEIADTIDDKNIQSNLKSQIALHIIGIGTEIDKDKK